MANYSRQQLMRLWVQAGGDPSKAGLAASIALAESSGRADAVNRNTNGSTDRGLWQINSIHGQQSTFDPMANARAAVAISNNGRSFTPWVTFNTGAYKRYFAGGGGSVASKGSPGPSAGTGGSTRMVGGVDNSGLRKQAILNFLFDNSKSKDPLALALRVRQLADVPGTPVSTPADSSVGGDNAVPAGKGGGGVAMFEGKKVPAWMVPALQYARQRGWKGSVTSGVRSYADQARLYANRGSNPYPVAPPGTSNHEIDVGGGAIDVSNPNQFAQILRGFKGRKPRRDPSIRDPVHFSQTGR